MIAYIRGTAEDITESSVILDNNGIGYEIYMTGRNLAQITVGSEYKIHTYFNVKEDGMQLYGFFTKDDLLMFRMLLGVNGIGPKGAIGVLSGLTADELRFAVLSDDVKTVSKAPGIGRKTAQKLILELKDKLDLEEIIERKTGISSSSMASASGEKNDSAETNKAREDAVEALITLGYSPTESLKAVRKVPENTEPDVEAVLKAALKFL
ncbi:MAG: Holliday junction branch migration protein RuvA [Blautia sp.]|nr:Holliday junction branch migration protein RuvA [Blautia sp.]